MRNFVIYIGILVLLRLWNLKDYDRLCLQLGEGIQEMLTEFCRKKFLRNRSPEKEMSWCIILRWMLGKYDIKNGADDLESCSLAWYSISCIQISGLYFCRVLRTVTMPHKSFGYWNMLQTGTTKEPVKLKTLVTVSLNYSLKLKDVEINFSWEKCCLKVRLNAWRSWSCGYCVGLVLPEGTFWGRTFKWTRLVDRNLCLNEHT